MKIAEFKEKFKNSMEFQDTVKALFTNRSVEETNSMVHIEILPSYDYSSLLNVVNKEMEDGTSLVLVLRSSFLSEERAMIIRQELIKRNLLDTIILIPSNWLDGANEDIALLYLNTNNHQKGVVKFIDITYNSGNDEAPDGKSVANLIYYDAFPDIENLREGINEDQKKLLLSYFDEFVYVAGHYEIKATGCSLEPARYIKRVPYYNGHHLYELWDIVDSAVKNAKGIIIHDYDLRDSASHYEIEVSFIKPSEGDGDYFVLNGKFILVAKTGKLRPSFVDTKGDTAYVLCDKIMAIKVDDNEYLYDYAISELRKPYVEWQREKWQRGLVPYLRIHLPDNTDDKSSIELQKESFVQSKFYDVCEYCKHPDLLYLMAEIGKEKIKKDASVPNRVRNVMESYVLPLLCKNNIKPEKDRDGKEPNLKTNISGYSKALANKAPTHIKCSFYTISFLAPEGSHDSEVQKVVRKGAAPYLTTTLVYDLINIIVWCKEFENKTI